MQLADIPLRYQKVWAVDAAGAYIRTVPVDSQIGIEDGAASFETGFVPDNFTAVSAGGVPPFGQDFNGLLNVDTAWMQWLQAGGKVVYDGTFAAAVGGYPKGAKLDSAIVPGAVWYSTTDGNLTDPDDPLTSSGWQRMGTGAGAIIAYPGTLPLYAWVPLNDASVAPFTIGSASSNATFADPSTLFLYIYNWSNSQLVIYTSGGVVTSRGANAVADFNANKRLAMPDARGAGLIGVDGAGSTNLSGVPVVAGNTTTPGSTLGENLHALTGGENGTHNHGVTDPTHTHAGSTVNLLNSLAPNGPGTGSIGAGASTPLNITNASTGISINNNGSGTGHNTVQRSLTVRWGQSL